MPDSIFHESMRQGITCSVFFFFCYFSYFVFAFMSLDCSLSNQESLLTSLLSFWLMIKLYHYYYYDSITSLYITKLYYSTLFFLNVMTIYWVLILLFSFSFHFYSPISFSFILQILFHLVLYLLFNLDLCYCIYHFILLFIPSNPFSQTCRVKSNSFILFFL